MSSRSKNLKHMNVHQMSVDKATVHIEKQVHYAILNVPSWLDYIAAAGSGGPRPSRQNKRTSKNLTLCNLLRWRDFRRIFKRNQNLICHFSASSRWSLGPLPRWGEKQTNAVISRVKFNLLVSRNFVLHTTGRPWLSPSERVSQKGTITITSTILFPSVQNRTFSSTSRIQKINLSINLSI